MRRRNYLKILGLGVAIGLAGCTEENGNNNGDDSNGNGNGNGSIGVRVEYDGEWSGSISENGGSRSVDGTGPETIDVDDESDIISANAQKQDPGSEEITIQIIVDGEVVEEESSTAEFGLVQVTYDDFGF